MPARDLLIPCSMFDTEIRIVEENDGYAVIAIRFDKAALAGFVQRNAQFISACADLAPAPVLVKVKDR